MATTEGRIRAPRSLGTTFAILLRTYATHVLVVPRSMPSRMGFSAMGALRRRMLRRPRRGWQETAQRQRSQLHRTGRESQESGRGGFSQIDRVPGERKSTRLNSSHLVISYAVFCLKKKNK